MSKSVPVSHEVACHYLAAMVCGLQRGGSNPTPAQFWRLLSDEFQADISAFVTKWPPGQSKERGLYRDKKANEKPDDPDTTTATPLN